MSILRTNRLIKTTKEHINSVEPLDLTASEFDREVLLAFLELPDAEMKTLVSPGGQIIAIMGAYKLWEGVAEVFLVPTKHMPENVFCYLRNVRMEIEDVSIRNNLHRLQTKSIANAQIDKFMELLGFIWEGNHLKYSRDKKNYRSWARFPNAV